MKLLAGAIGLFGLLAVPLLGQVYVPPGGVMPMKGMSPVRMTTVPYSGPAVVIGQIVDAATGRGVSHAIVHLEGQGTEITRLADTSGRFYVVGLGGGDYSINATKTGYFDGAYGQRRPGGEGLPLSMLEHQWVSDLKIALWRPAVIGGTVTDEAGEPLIGVRVEALRKQYEGGALQLVPWMTTVTNDQGDYRLAKLQPGDYVISVPSTVGSVPDLNAIRVVTGPPDAPVPDNDAMLAMQDVLSQAQNIRTDASGAYTLVRGLQTPPPPLGASRPEMYATTYFGGASVSSGALTLTVGPGETRLGASVQLRPVPLGAISGTVTGPAGPLQNQALRLVAAGENDLGFGHETAITRTNTDGTFAFPEVPQGDYVIEASTSAAFRLGIVTSDADEPGNRKVTGLFATVQEAEDSDKPALWGRTRVTLADRDVTDVKIDMEPAVTVSGHVIFEGASAKPPEKIGEHFCARGHAGGRAGRSFTSREDRRRRRVRDPRSGAQRVLPPPERAAAGLVHQSRDVGGTRSAFMAARPYIDRRRRRSRSDLHRQADGDRRRRVQRGARARPWRHDRDLPGRVVVPRHGRPASRSRARDSRDERRRLSRRRAAGW